MVVENKKIKGATAVDLEEIHFKSKLEKSCYLKLTDAGYEVIYEPERVVVWVGGRLTECVVAYQPSKSNRKEVEAITRPLLPITYTPDFLVKEANLYCYFDAKGYANDRYPMKKKMFLKYLCQLGAQNPHNIYLFFEVQTIAQLTHAIQIIKNMSPLEKIKTLIPKLPESDLAHAEKFIADRDFRSLWELVHSCIIRVWKNKSKEVPNPKYNNIDAEDLQTLEAEVSNYLTMIDPHWSDDTEPDEDNLDPDEEH